MFGYKKVIVKMFIPIKATHWNEDLDNPTFYYCKIINEQEHWFYMVRNSSEWKFFSHRTPNFIKALEFKEES